MSTGSGNGRGYAHLIDRAKPWWKNARLVKLNLCIMLLYVAAFVLVAALVVASVVDAASVAVDVVVGAAALLVVATSEVDATRTAVLVVATAEEDRARQRFFTFIGAASAEVARRTMDTIDAENFMIA